MNYIVVLGKGIEVLRDGKVEPRVETKLNVLAAYVLYEDGVGDKIIFSGGHTKGKDRPSEAIAMLDYLRSYAPKFKNENIILEENSIDTAGNAYEVGKLIDKNSKVILLTTGYHLQRSKQLFKNYAVKVDSSYSSGKVLEQASPRFDFILKQYNLKRRLWEILWEAGCFILVKTIDPKEKLLREITSRRRT
jgi:uncharacterized SAM-binding protein YcdF (DUF218 family)